MILVDFSQVVLGNIIVHLNKEAKSADPEGAKLIKHMTFSTLISLKNKFKEYGDLVICLDGRKYWRKDPFPLYKAHRKESRDKSDLDFEFIYKVIDEVKEDIRTSFNWKMVEFVRAEADDVIATLVNYSQNNELGGVGIFDGEPQPMMIVSSDTDFVQLHRFPNVKQWSTMQNKMVKSKVPLKEFMVEHIVRGDAGDGVPNIFSPRDSIVTKTRQKSVTAVKLQQFFDKGIEACSNDYERERYKENTTLVDLSCIPQDVTDGIMESYHKECTKVVTKKQTMDYLIKNRMVKLMERMGEL